MSFTAKLLTPIFILITIAPMAFAKSKDEVQESEKHIPTVTVVDARMDEVVLQVPISGDVAPVEEVLVYPHVNGFGIQSLTADVGDYVEEGEVLATLDDATLGAQLAQAQASRDQAFAELERAKALRKAGTISQASFDQTNAAAINAQSQLDIMSNNHGSSQILAPVAGIISARNGKLGAISTTAGDPIYQIIAGGEVEIVTQVSETALGQIKTGDMAEMTLASGRLLKGKVRRVAPTVDTTTRLATVWIGLDETENLTAGMFTSGWIVSNRHQGLVVPATAILSDHSGTFVQVVKDGLVEKRPVLAGAVWLSEREVIDGLQEGETVIARAGAFFTTGDEVNAIMSEDMVSETATTENTAENTTENAEEIASQAESAQ